MQTWQVIIIQTGGGALGFPSEFPPPPQTQQQIHVWRGVIIIIIAESVLDTSVGILYIGTQTLSE